MPLRKTVTSMLLTMRHDAIRLGTRAATDETGSMLLHDIRNLLMLLEAAEERAPPDAELVLMMNASAALHERVVDYTTDPAVPRIARVAARLPSDPLLSPDEIARVEEAYAGPSVDTMAKCPACAGCLLCADRRLVSIRDAVDWRTRSVSKGS